MINPGQNSAGMVAERPIFVVGAPRSGTTLLRYMLSSHPRIYIPPESNFIPRLFQRHPHAPLGRQQAIRILNDILSYRVFFKDWRGERIDAAAFVDRLPDLMPVTLLDSLYSQYARQFGAGRWGDKSPIYTTAIDLIAEIFPTAQFIHIIRDGRDVALSMLKAYQSTRFFYMDIYFAARTWKQRVSAAAVSGGRLGVDRYHEVRYERLAADPEAQLREICDFLGEAFAPAMVEPHKVARERHHSTGIHAATRQPPTTTSSGRWRREMSTMDQRLFQVVAGDLLDELGYGVASLGQAPLAERARYARLYTKYTVVEASRRALQGVGVFHPSWLLARLIKAGPKAARKERSAHGS